MRLLVLLLLAAVATSGPAVNVVPASAQDAEVPVHLLWRADAGTGFAGWALDGVRATERGLMLDAASASASTSTETSGLTRPDGRAGLAVGPVQATAAPFRELIPSWNAETPPGSWVEVRLRARIGGDDGRWTRWYELGSWATDSGTDRRQSVKGQRDDDGRVATDTVLLSAAASAHQLAFILHADTPAADGGPLVTLAAVLASSPSRLARDVPPSPAAWGVTLDVPERSQMLYAGGGPVWCSPTSTSMVLAYWSERLGKAVLDQPVPTVAAAVYDPVYRGSGNWPFNTAYAGRDGLTAYVSRMSSLAQVERWIEAGSPVVASLAWAPGDLGSAAAVPSTDGHVLVIVGFTAAGDVVVNDPAADPRLGQPVRRVYPRGAFERLWLAHSGGTVYLVYPTGSPLPPADVAFGAW
jgi:hypothetical protein